MKHTILKPFIYFFKYYSSDILSIISGLLFSVGYMWIYAFFLVIFKKSYLLKKSIFIESTGGLALPSVQSLSELNISFIFSSGAFVGLSLGIFLGIVISLFISTIKSLSNRVNLGVWFMPAILSVIGIILCFFVGNDYYPLISLPFFLTLPFIVYAGHLLPTFFKKKRLFLIKPDLIHLINSITLLILLFFSVLLFFYLKNHSIDYIKVRDNFLLTTNVGKGINSFYYIHTPLATETIKPIKGRKQITILYIGNDKNTIKNIKEIRKKMWLFMKSTIKKEEIEKVIKSRGIDIILIDELFKENYQYLFNKYDIESKSVILLGKNSQTGEEKNNKIQSISKPFNIKKIISTIRNISDASDRSKGLRSLIKLALFDYVWVPVAGFTFISVFICVFIPIILLDSLIKPCHKKIAFTGLFFLASLLLIYPLTKNIKNSEKNSLIKKIQEAAKGKEIAKLTEFLNKQDNEVRYLTVTLLVKLAKKTKETEIFNAFMRAIGDNDPRIRMYSAVGLGHLGDERAVIKLLAGLNDKQINVRYKSAQALGKIGSKKALKPLENLIKENKFWYVSDYALNALRKIKR